MSIMVSSLLYLLFLIPVTLALLSEGNDNLTISFSPADPDTCASNGSSQAITFSTGSIPAGNNGCFNIEELFGSANSSTVHGALFFNTSIYTSHEPVDWVLMMYLQQNFATAKLEKARRFLGIYSGEHCTTTATSADTYNPTIGWSCQSSTNGSCSQAPYSIRSFFIGSTELLSEHSECVTNLVGPTGIDSMSAKSPRGSMALTFMGLFGALVALGFLDWNYV
ncbi:hypothetical protein E4T39_05991 [Aureobasidium subglaciale]|nr:hypothetical protein E4T39_05991 [Aureobasidium subglaciale]